MAPRPPRTYDECRAEFRAACERADIGWSAHPIAALGPSGDALTIDIAVVGQDDPERAVVVMSGVHGVEGFIGSALQTDLVVRTDPRSLPPGAALVMVHAVNPWGMAHDRRQNEHNVDLNRNWRRTQRTPHHNAAYDELHPLLCPDSTDVPDVDQLIAALAPFIDEHGIDWVVQGITAGQYRHSDGLHFGGDGTEESCSLLEREVPLLAGAARDVLTIDLHTGVGPFGTLTLLSNQPPGSPQDRFLVDAFGDLAAPIRRPSVDSPAKPGSIGNGLADVLPDAECVAVTAEFGTASDMRQLAATHREQWVHRRGDIDSDEHREIRREYRRCFTPEDDAWSEQAWTRGRALLDAAVGTLASPH